MRNPSETYYPDLKWLEKVHHAYRPKSGAEQNRVPVARVLDAQTERKIREALKNSRFMLHDCLGRNAKGDIEAGKFLEKAFVNLCRRMCQMMLNVNPAEMLDRSELAKRLDQLAYLFHNSLDLVTEWQGGFKEANPELAAKILYRHTPEELEYLLSKDYWEAKYPVGVNPSIFDQVVTGAVKTHVARSADPVTKLEEYLSGKSRYKGGHLVSERLQAA